MTLMSLTSGRPATVRESRRRSLAKAISWRVVGSLDTLLLSFLILTFLAPLFGVRADASHSDNIETASYIAIAEVITKTLLYFLHERAWSRLKWAARKHKNGHHRDGLRRSTVKAATWRILASLDTALLALLFTGNFLTALTIGGTEVITKVLLYILHERIWVRVGYGVAVEQ